MTKTLGPNTRSVSEDRRWKLLLPLLLYRDGVRQLATSTDFLSSPKIACIHHPSFDECVRVNSNRINVQTGFFVKGCEGFAVSPGKTAPYLAIERAKAAISGFFIFVTGSALTAAGLATGASNLPRVGLFYALCPHVRHPSGSMPLYSVYLSPYGNRSIDTKPSFYVVFGANG
ncbi:hypothetical protein M405DRAFT_838960 [Rhizopogon salebrosus TDB-379]|nr:hypothetical protein M405DRAFT_838960 [Rhizopogon salebrosus TDB-379]